MQSTLIDPDEPPERQIERLTEISAALMRRVEQDMDGSGAAYAQFERSVMLEDQVRERTRELEQALGLLNESNAQLAQANRDIEAARADLSNAIEAVQEGFALFSAEDHLVMCNSRFGQQMHDIVDRLLPGLSFREYVDLVSRSRFLMLPEGENCAQWAAQRIRHHVDDHAMINIQLAQDKWLQVSEHRTLNGGTVILQTDITDVVRSGREEREKLLDAQARMIRATLDHLNQGVAIFDHKTRLVGWNNRLGSLLRLPPARLRIGTKFDRLSDWVRARFRVSDDTVLGLLEKWRGSEASSAPLSFELQDDGRVTLDTFVRKMPDGGFVVSLTDVTAEREATRALSLANETLEQRVMERTLELEDALDAAERANASKSRFVAAASHDLLQPLSAAKLYLATISDPDHAPVLEKAEQALVSVQMIIEDLLEISKLDSGAATLSIRDVGLNEVLLPLRDEFAPLATLKGLDLRVVPCDATIRSDPAYLRRILQNLIGNAVRYTHQGKVLVGCRRMRETVRVEVWDTGPGIREEDQEAIFQEFQRLDARASASEGMGLGLAIVERACDRLGHPLGLWSVPGRGSGFFVNLGRANGSSAAPGEARKPAAPTLQLKDAGLIVLLVENDTEFRRALSVLLGKWDVSVLDVAGADEAVALLEEIQITPDAMLIDFQLDKGDNGLDLARRLNAVHGSVPTCILSANRSVELRQACARAGLPLINKPIEAARLEEFLIRAAARSK